MKHQAISVGTTLESLLVEDKANNPAQAVLQDPTLPSDGSQQFQPYSKQLVHISQHILNVYLIIFNARSDAFPSQDPSARNAY